jgi:hypothetical protein
MSKTNCVNCGAAKDTSEIKCPFCGTTYMDFTAIDFTSGDPVVCQFVMPWSKQRTIMSMMAIPQLDEMTIAPRTMDVTSLWDYTHRFISAPPEINIGISFIPVERNGHLMSIRTEE